jgi:hypothetical protein
MYAAGSSRASLRFSIIRCDRLFLFLLLLLRRWLFHALIAAGIRIGSGKLLFLAVPGCRKPTLPLWIVVQVMHDLGFLHFFLWLRPPSNFGSSWAILVCKHRNGKDRAAALACHLPAGNRLVNRRLILLERTVAVQTVCSNPRRRKIHSVEAKLDLGTTIRALDLHCFRFVDVVGWILAVQLYPYLLSRYHYRTVVVGNRLRPYSSSDTSSTPPSVSLNSASLT